jgi:hypothetical protein
LARHEASRTLVGLGRLSRSLCPSTTRVMLQQGTSNRDHPTAASAQISDLQSCFCLIYTLHVVWSLPGVRGMLLSHPGHFLRNAVAKLGSWGRSGVALLPASLVVCLELSDLTSVDVVWLVNKTVLELTRHILLSLVSSRARRVGVLCGRVSQWSN